MGREVTVEGDEVLVRLSGVTALAALRRELRIPRRAIEAVRWGAPMGAGIRVGGTALPFTDYRQGRFWKPGQLSFYSIEDRNQAITLELDRDQMQERYNQVVVGVDEPEKVAAILLGRTGA